MEPHTRQRGDSPEPGGLHDVVWAVLREGSHWPESESDCEAGDSDAPVVTPAIDAARRRPGSEYAGPVEQEEQEQNANTASASSAMSISMLNGLEQWVDADIPESPESTSSWTWWRDSGLAGLEETKPGLSGGDGGGGGGGGKEAKPLKSCLKEPRRTSVPSLPLSVAAARNHATENQVRFKFSVLKKHFNEKKFIKSFVYHN
jgi:hypothetical protein